jgi:hypothetical protein
LGLRCASQSYHVLRANEVDRRRERDRNSSFVALPAWHRNAYRLFATAEPGEPWMECFLLGLSKSHWFAYRLQLSASTTVSTLFIVMVTKAENAPRILGNRYALTKTERQGAQAIADIRPATLP